MLEKFRRLFSRMEENDRRMLLYLAQRLQQRGRPIKVAVPRVARRSRGTTHEAVTRPRTGAFRSYFVSPLRYSMSFCWSAGVSFAP